VSDSDLLTEGLCHETAARNSARAGSLDSSVFDVGGTGS